VLSRSSANLAGPVSLSSFVLPYSDAGLFGIYVEAPAATLKKAIEAGVADLKKVRARGACAGGRGPRLGADRAPLLLLHCGSTVRQAAKEVSAADLARGKAQAKQAILSAYEARGSAVEDLVRQATGAAKVEPVGDVLAKLDKVTADDVAKVRAGVPGVVGTAGRADANRPRRAPRDPPLAGAQAAAAALKSKPTAVAYGDVHEAPLSVSLGL